MAVRNFGGACSAGRYLFGEARRMKRVGILLAGLGAVGAGTPAFAADPVSSGPSAHFPLAAANQIPQDYRIGPLDKISITVFQEPDLSVKDVQVEASGQILLPLIGAVQAAGKTSSQLAQEITTRLGERYLQSPQVSVLVSESVSQRVTVEGTVTEPGIYESQGPTTLLQAIALAKGMTPVASSKDVVIFRVINGQRMGARFAVNDISNGRADDPAILGNDIVEVGLSRSKAMWRDVLRAAPLASIFAPLIW